LGNPQIRALKPCVPVLLHPQLHQARRHIPVVDTLPRERERPQVTHISRTNPPAHHHRSTPSSPTPVRIPIRTQPPIRPPRRHLPQQGRRHLATAVRIPAHSHAPRRLKPAP